MENYDFRISRAKQQINDALGVRPQPSMPPMPMQQPQMQPMSMQQPQQAASANMRMPFAKGGFAVR